VYATVYSNLAIVNDDRYELSYTNLHCEPKKNSPKCLCHIFCKTRPIRIKKWCTLLQICSILLYRNVNFSTSTE